MSKPKTKITTALILVALSTALLCLPLVVKIPSGETNPWIEFIGGFHPVFLHFPIGFLMLILALELLSLFSKKKNQLPMQAALILNALTSVNAALLGFVLYLTGSWSGETIEDHLWGGLTYAVCAIWLPYIYHLTASRTKLPYMLVLLGSAVVMTLAAHDGGEITHGDPMDLAPWKQEEKVKSTIASPEDVKEGEVFDPVFYTGVIVPILEEKCYSCHGEKRGRGGLRMHEMELFLEGGDEEIALEPGNVEESFFITTLHLPIDDDYHMPPESKPQITENEAALLEFWVTSGAATDKKFSELNPSPEIETALNAILNASPQDGDDDSSDHTDSHSDQEKRSAELESLVTEAQKKLGTSLNWLSLDSPDLQFSAVSIRKQWSDEHISALQTVSANLNSLNLNGTSVGDNIAELLSQSNQLKDLRLAETSISNAVLTSLPDSLEVLNLHSTSIDDAGLEKLKGKENLKRIYLWNSKVTEEGKQKLAELLPNLEIL